MSTQKRIIFLFSLAYFLQLTIFIIGVVNYPGFLTNELGYGNTFAGTMVGLIAISNLVAVLPLGLLSDRISPRKLYQSGLVCIMAFFLFVPVAKHRWLAWLVFLLGGTGFAALRTVLPVLYYKYLPTERRSVNVSIFLSTGFLGFAVGGMLGALAQAYNPCLPFYAAMGLSVLLFALTFALPDAKPEKISFLEYLRDIAKPKALVILGVFVLMGIHFGVEQYGLPKLILEGLRLSSTDMAKVYLAVGIGLAGTAFLLREFFEKRPKHLYYFGVGLIVSGVFHAMTSLATGMSSLLGVRMGHVIGDGLILVTHAVIVVSIFPGVRMGGNLGLLGLLNSIGQFAGAFLTGFLIDLSTLPPEGVFSPYKAPFALSGTLMVVLGALFLIFSGLSGKRQSNPLAD